VGVAKGSVSLKNPGVSRAVLLDVNGYRVRDVPVKRVGDGVTVELPREAMYLVLE
jgi:hypothetical protein